MTFSADKPTMIEFKDVHKYYGDYHALRGINGTIKAGEFFSLLGPSGCGKTTLLRTIAGFEGISSGAVLIDGKSMEGVPPNEPSPALRGRLNCRSSWSSLTASSPGC